jgi:hypothetical protein
MNVIRTGNSEKQLQNGSIIPTHFVNLAQTFALQLGGARVNGRNQQWVQLVLFLPAIYTVYKK